jgi:hypothetical protein
MQVATRSAIYGPLLTEKTLENATFVENQTTWHCALNLSYKSMEKNGAISRMSRNNVLSDGAFSPPRTPSVEHGLFLDILEMTPTFATKLQCPW